MFCLEIWFCWLKFLADFIGAKFDHWSYSHPHSSQRGCHSMFLHCLVDNVKYLGTYSKAEAEPLCFLVFYFFVGLLLSLNALRIERGSSEIQGKIHALFPITI